MIRIGVDFGGTKIEAAALNERGEYVARIRRPNPGDYEDAVQVVREVVDEVEKQAGVGPQTVGLGMPGSISPKTGRVRNANSVWLNDKPFDRDVKAALGREVRVANDANCFALSEATDGAGAGARVVVGVILGTGCGGGLVVDGQLIDGVNGVAAEIGHMPLPWPSVEERGAHKCWCGRIDCLETWTSGSAFVADYHEHTGEKLTGDKIMARARSGEAEAAAAFDRYVDRLGRALAVLGDVIDPDVFVFGGGMSNTDELYDRVPAVLGRYIFSDVLNTKVLKAVHGDSSGVRGAAWLWPLDK
jgi:fructokinase